MEPQHFGHRHPLVFNQELIIEATHCSRCGETMSGPSFSCDECGFFLHKECAEAPSQIDHPIHRDHPLCLFPNPPATPPYSGRLCNFCGERVEKFIYHCSCEIDLHIKCAMFTYNIAEKKFADDLKGIAYKDPPISTENHNGHELGKFKCFVCWEPLFDSAYYSLDRGLHLHKKCAELSFEIRNQHHSQHLLFLQFSVGERRLSCSSCFHDITDHGLFYCCSLCKFALHMECESLPSVVQGKGHQHPFTLFFRQMNFTCDACGLEGNSIPYLCLNCNLLVHKKCISLPPIIKFMWHEHPISHTFSLDPNHFKKWDCMICLDEVNRNHGSYSCSKCHFIVHVGCATRRKPWYYAIESVEKFDDDSVFSHISMDSYIVIERNQGGDATKIKHFSHEHDLMLSDKVTEVNEFCDGCTLSISDSFYYCSECDYFLHKRCAELPKKKHVLFHFCQQLHILIEGCVFKCSNICGNICNGFAYKCHACGQHSCLRCAGISSTLTLEGHQHPLVFTVGYRGKCGACGRMVSNGYRCKLCEFTLCGCSLAPRRIRHKFDDHLLTLTYRDDNTYSESHYCDVCEKDRNPNHWFYYCSICDNSIHPYCVVSSRKYPYMKSGKIYKEGKLHPHPLRFVRRMYSYPECSICGDPCQELAFECVEPKCEYIVHWNCIGPSHLLKK